MGEEYSLVFGQITGESNMAMAHRALGRLGEALDHSEKAVKLLESSGQMEAQEEILFNHYLVLRDNQVLDEARDYLKRAYDKMVSKAGKIKNPVARETFLNRVTVNRSITSSLKEQAFAVPSG